MIKNYLNLIIIIQSVMFSFLVKSDARNSSVVYTRWGKKICPSNAKLVFSGK